MKSLKIVIDDQLNSYTSENSVSLEIHNNALIQFTNIA